MKTIRELLEQQGWTQLQLAIKLGVTPVTVYNWERGKTEPKVGQFRSLARVLGVSMDDIALPEPGPET
ncbi:MAG: helix-turn-helix domain-containing protein [Chloroflexota bacterium]|nr:helix-turn-helix domain-containing protein [Chloroflexota bacterium]